MGSQDVERDESHARLVVEPLRTNDRVTVLVGSLVWAVLLLVCLLRREQLEAAGTGWWVWTCAAGLVLGLVGLAWLQVRHRRGVRD